MVLRRVGGIVGWREKEDQKVMDGLKCVPLNVTEVKSE